MIVLTEALEDTDAEPRDLEIARHTQCAREAGARLFHFHPDFPSAMEADVALAHLPDALPGEPCIWVGTIPSPERYADVEREVARRGATLVNSQAAHLVALELQRAYPHIAEWTARTAEVRDLKDVPAALARVGLPAFIKGAVFSRKTMGWKACVAQTPEEAETLVSKLLAMPTRARGVALLREVLPLRRAPAQGDMDFPVAREYRVFLLDGEPLEWGFYWFDETPFGPLSAVESAEMLSVARAVAARLPTRLLSVDVAQLEDGSFRCIEVGDPQFSGLSHLSAKRYWTALAARLG
jgi:hypothetical protein